MAENDRPKAQVARNLGRLTEAQDSALDYAAQEMSRRRGTPVSRADITREALADYVRKEGLPWPC